MARRPLAIAAASLRITLAAALSALTAPAGAAPANPESAVIETAEPPTSVALPADGSAVFVGMDRHFSEPGGIAAYGRNAWGGFVKLGTVTVVEGVRAIALTRDEAALVFTTRSGPGIVEVAPLRAGRDSTAASERDGAIAGSDQLVVSRDGRYAYFTNQRDASVGVASIERAEGGAPSLRIVAHVRVDRLPGGIAQSNDGALLYVASEIDGTDAARVPGSDDLRLGRARCIINHGPAGVLSVIDAWRALHDSNHAILGRIACGCAPVRVALSPAGDLVWVSVRGDDRVFAFDAAKLTVDPTRALVAELNTGPQPVGIVATHDGANIVVAASDGDAGINGPWHSNVAAFDAVAARRNGNAVTPKTLEGGRRLRELSEGADGTIWVTDYIGRTVRSLAPL